MCASDGIAIVAAASSAEGRHQPSPVGVELLHPVLQPADDERDPEHEHAVREDRADERRLDDVDEAAVEREERDEELGQVPESGLNDARPAGAQSGAELLGRGPDEAGERGQRTAVTAKARTSFRPAKWHAADTATRTATRAISRRSRRLTARSYQAAHLG